MKINVSIIRRALLDHSTDSSSPESCFLHWSIRGIWEAQQNVKVAAFACCYGNGDSEAALCWVGKVCSLTMSGTLRALSRPLITWRVLLVHK